RLARFTSSPSASSSRFSGRTTTAASTPLGGDAFRRLAQPGGRERAGHVEVLLCPHNVAVLEPGDDCQRHRDLGTVLATGPAADSSHRDDGIAGVVSLGGFEAKAVYGAPPVLEIGADFGRTAQSTGVGGFSSATTHSASGGVSASISSRSPRFQASSIRDVVGI